MELNTLGNGLLEGFDIIDDSTDDELTDVGNLLNTVVRHQLVSPTAGALYSTLIEGFFEIPDFQRKFVWNKKQVALLGFSIIKGIPIPSLYTYKKDRLEVLIDGQQRLISLFLYFNDLFVINKRSPQKHFKEIDGLCREYEKNTEVIENSDDESLKADAEQKNKEIEKRLNQLGVQKTTYTIKKGNDDVDITFSKFDPKDQLYLKQREMYITKIECGKENNRKLYTTIFALFNTAGKQLGAQEVRNGLFIDSTLYKAVATYNVDNANWRKIFGEESIHSKDMEMLIKMLALEYFTEINEEGNVCITENRDFTFNWSNLIVRFSELTENAEPVIYIEKLKAFMDNIEVEGEIQKKKINPAVLEAFFVVTTKLKINLATDKITYKYLCNIGEEKEIPFPKVLSNKDSVNERLKITTEYVRKKYQC
ncbi:DUF262 domain-containing protein [Butyrivibrio sp. AE3003]|uniref:DUF262 domain-containing protein n=1 Tax=Butyrivibrio sp. AE3003 TaxID=1496721 RepID=UPI00047E2740|nr:DUF262 domain-containing protein [Butyrivibrio sp. AE3003]